MLLDTRYALHGMCDTYRCTGMWHTGMVSSVHMQLGDIFALLTYDYKLRKPLLNFANNICYMLNLNNERMNELASRQEMDTMRLRMIAR